MTMFGKQIEVVITMFYVAEVTGTDRNGKETTKRITQNFEDREQANEQMMKMPFGAYRIKKAQVRRQFVTRQRCGR